MSRVALEGKTRLPNRLQEMVVDLGTMVAGVVRCTSASGGGEPLGIVLRNFAGMDPLLDNSVNNLEKCRTMVERMTSQNSTVDRCVAELSEVQDVLQQVEREGYYSISSGESHQQTKIN